MELVVSPASVTLTTQFGASLAALKAGTIIEAQVLALLADGRVRLAIADTVVEAVAQAPLVPGMTIHLALRNTAQGLRLVLLDKVPTGSFGGADTPAAAGGAVTTAPPALQPLADVASTVHAAARALQGTSSTDAVAAPPPAGPPAAASGALVGAIQQAAARQSGLAPLFANVAVAASLAALPQPVRLAAARLMALRSGLDERLTAAGLRQAFRRSGLFLEADLAKAAEGVGSRAKAAIEISSDLKAALVVFRHVLRAWLEDAGGARQAEPLARPAQASLRPASPPREGPAPPAAASHAAPPPPYRGALPAAQPIATPSIAPELAPLEIGKAFLAETESAIARQTLLQVASLPEHPQALSSRGDASGPRWSFEVPFVMPQGTAVAQFEIARDGQNGPAEEAKPLWRVRFSLAIEPLGPVHAQIVLAGSRTAVTLWAERPTACAKLRAGAPALAEGLRQAALEPRDIVVRDGFPPRPQGAIAVGGFLDRAS